MGFLIQFLINKQNNKLQAVMHAQNMELENKKRADYLICRNYDETLEMGKQLHQLLLWWWGAGARGEEGKRIDKLWYYDWPVRCKDKVENISMGKFLQENDLFMPSKIMDLILEASDANKAKQYDKLQELAIEAEIELIATLGIDKSKEEISLLFQLVAEKEKL
jgi:hypothetical protein